ncbi:hypothetical protein EI94DRAFT_1708138 [Lactarius quietus]|nr:hypothetical protein EI94DRAFT_1708138 [Lactarius quietus]
MGRLLVQAVWTGLLFLLGVPLVSVGSAVPVIRYVSPLLRYASLAVCRFARCAVLAIWMRVTVGALSTDVVDSLDFLYSSPLLNRSVFSNISLGLVAAAKEDSKAFVLEWNYC